MWIPNRLPEREVPALRDDKEWCSGMRNSLIERFCPGKIGLRKNLLQ